jgi:oligoendopeptidase F
LFSGIVEAMKNLTEWNLKLLYSGIDDPQLEKDMKKIESACTQFEKKYKDKKFTQSVAQFETALKDYEKLLNDATYKPLWYLGLYKDIASSDSNVRAREAQVNQRQRVAFNKVLFFELEVGKIDKKKQDMYLNHPSLTYFKYFLQKLFLQSQYNLSEKEEQLLSLVSQPAEKMWYDAQQKLLSSQMLPFKSGTISLSEANEILPDLPKKERVALYKEIVQARKATAHLAEAEINAIYSFKKIMDERKGYKHPYSRTVLQYENEEKEVEQLVTTITNYFTLSKKYYALHAKLLGLNKLSIDDVYVSIGEIKEKFDFETSVRVVKRSFSKFGAEYAEYLDRYLHNGQIDVFPRKNKQAGGYSSGLEQYPVFILLNHVDNLSSVETLAHEMGHSIHTEMSKHHGALYGDYTIAAAEVASTFFEQFVIEDLFESLPDDQKIILLHQKLSRDMATVFRQIACFNCELELHRQIRDKGQLSKDEMARIMQKHLSSYLGKAVEVTEDDGYVYTSWSHLRYSFYTYTYAYGQLISRSLFEKWKKNPSFKEKIEQFLSAGSTMSPKNIFKSIGINVNSAFFEDGLKGIETDIKKLEQLARKQKRI